MRFERVKLAYQQKFEFIRQKLDSVGINSSYEILIFSYKREEILEVWVKEIRNKEFRHLMNFTFCNSSGTLGPKRQLNDYQIPEGFYHINVFSPNDDYYLALKVNYPNVSDLILKTAKHPGQEIYTHGYCCTIGCIPITNEKIQELYILCVEARNSGQQRIPVYMFPSRLDSAGLEESKKVFATYNWTREKTEKVIRFWENLKIGYDYFHRNKILPNISVDKNGKYLFK